MRRVVVTGMGAVTPVGNNVNEFWTGLKAGKLGISPIDFFDTEGFKVKVAAKCDINVADYLDKKELRRMSRFMQLGMIAASEAIEQSEIEKGGYEKERIGVLVGSGIGGLLAFETEVLKMDAKKVSPYCIPMLILNMLSGSIAIKYGYKGHCSAVVTACSTGNNAIGDGADLIRYGKLDAVIVGGSEGVLGKTEIAGFANMMALTKSDDPKRASIPFDKERGGFVMGEGAGILVLEEYEAAVKRGANILCEITGYGSTCDAYHLTAPCPDGDGAKRAIEIAIKEAGIEKSEVGYINAHGTGTALNDRIETLAIKSVFGAYSPPVSSTKSMTGHLLGAAGAVEAICCIMAIKDGFLPPTIGYKEFDPECDLDIIPNKGREQKISCALSDSFGFGGHNTALIFQECK